MRIMGMVENVQKMMRMLKGIDKQIQSSVESDYDDNDDDNDDYDDDDDGKRPIAEGVEVVAPLKHQSKPGVNSINMIIGNDYHEYHDYNHW